MYIACTHFECSSNEHSSEWFRLLVQYMFELDSQLQSISRYGMQQRFFWSIQSGSHLPPARPPGTSLWNARSSGPWRSHRNRSPRVPHSPADYSLFYWRTECPDTNSNSSAPPVEIWSAKTLARKSAVSTAAGSKLEKCVL